MYRKEDLMRAYHFDIEKFGNQVINFFPISPKEKLAEVNHYEGFIARMKEEGIEKSGHLSEVNDLTKALSALHEKLKSTDNKYLEVYKKAQPHIEENIQLSNGKISDEIQICLNGVYGFFLLKIEERPITAEEQTMIDQFGNLLSLLGYIFEENKKQN